MLTRCTETTERVNINNEINVDQVEPTTSSELQAMSIHIVINVYFLGVFFGSY